MSSHAHQTNSFAQPKWWKESVIYQVYPSSFQSHAGAKTGWGSIKGITSRVDYLKSLGVDILWSSPILRSPQADMGYDVADYKQIDPTYGTLEDVDELISELHKRGMKFVMDLVVNHTSNEHAWFLESASSKDSPKRDWYIWRKPSGHDEAGNPLPPNNWAMILGDGYSAWTYSAATGEYYLSLFTPEQPDLNWECPDVRAAVWDVMHFWLQRGAAGFRMDVINLISKVQTFPDAPVALPPGHKYQPAFKFFANGPRLHEYLGEMHAEVLSKYDTITVGEMPHISDDNEILRTVGADAGELRMIFNFDVVDIDKPAVRMQLKPWDVPELKGIITKWQTVMVQRDGWNSVFIENHDNPRSVSRYADDSDAWRATGAKLLALMQTTLNGTLFVYQGEEIGMRNVPRNWPVEEFKDCETINYWRKMNELYPGDKEKLAEARHLIDVKARDHARTPMQWDDGPNAGFCDEGVTPWMRVIEDYKTINAAAQMASKDNEDDGEKLSVWRFWQRALADRKAHKDVFVYGDFVDLDPGHPAVYAYVRTSTKGEQWIVVLNFSGGEVSWKVPGVVEANGVQVKVDLGRVKWERGNYGEEVVRAKGKEGVVVLGPWEGVVGRVV